MKYNYEYIVLDPVLGQVSMEGPTDAIDYAKKVKGVAMMITWLGSKEIKREIVK